MIPALMFYATKLRNIIRINKFYFHTKFVFYVLPLDVTNMCCNWYALPLYVIPYFPKLGTYILTGNKTGLRAVWE